MNRTILVALVAAMLGGLSLAAQGPAEKQELDLPSQLADLLRAEMQALLVGVQSIPGGIATADWRSVADTAAKLKASYILEQQLTAEQKKTLVAALPEHFRRLDADFHVQAGKLEAAAAARDAELASFHFSRLLETCTACHALYAASRFPGFSHASEPAHAH